MSYENYDTGYRFSSPAALRLCVEVVNLAMRPTSALHFTQSDKDIAIRNLNIELLQEHILHMKSDSSIRQAHKTIAHLRRLNKQSQAEGCLL